MQLQGEESHQVQVSNFRLQRFLDAVVHLLPAPKPCSKEHDRATVLILIFLKNLQVPVPRLVGCTSMALN